MEGVISECLVSALPWDESKGETSVTLLHYG